MRYALVITGILVLGSTRLAAQGHIAPCNGANDHTGGICYGYATGRAAGRSAGDANCNPMTFYQNYINPTFFTEYYNLNGMSNGDIVKFGNHVAYVVYVGNPLSTTVLDQYSTMRLREERVTLAQAESEFGSAVGYYRAKTIGVTVQNNFAGGEVIIWGSNRSAGTQNLDWTQGIPVSVEPTQQVSGKNYEYRYWNTPNGQQSPRSFTLYPRLSESYTATYAEYFNLTFQNNLPGGPAGQIKVGGTTQSAPYYTTVYKEPGAGQPSVTAEGIYQEHGSVQFTFAQWSDGNTTNPRTFSITTSGTVTASYSAKPNPPTNVAATGFGWSECDNKLD